MSLGIYVYSEVLQRARKDGVLSINLKYFLDHRDEVFQLEKSQV